MTKAIRPEEVAAVKAKLLPEFVLRAFNECIVEDFSGSKAVVEQKDVINKMIHFADYQLSQEEIFAKGYLNVEDIYREQGWKVAYEGYGSFFVFRTN